tara:strand:+ start:740 stop:1474 length:735 start_codon:yes stop_codon:yes gene_type:complete
MKNKEKNSTLDLEENKKFDNFSKKWWNVKGELMALHLFNEVRIPYILTSLNQNISTERPLKNFNILDIGCGGGILCEPLKRLGADVTGIDTNKFAIEVARSHAQKNRLSIDYYHSSIEDFNTKKKFDLVTCMEVLEHIKNIDTFIKSIKPILKNDSILVGSTINKTFRSYIKAIIFAENVFNLLPKNTHNWSKFVNTNRLKKTLYFNNFSELKSNGIEFNPLVKSWKFVDSKNTNYLFSARYKI